MAADYGLWWLINDFRKASLELRNTENLENIRININDPGLASNIFLQSINAFQLKFINTTSEMIACLPDPKPPDMQRYATIAFIGGVIVLSFVLEPFCARMRICIMNFYYPAVSRRRAIWLYNQILRGRASYLKYARRRLKRKYGKIHRNHVRDVLHQSMAQTVFKKYSKRFQGITNLFGEEKVGKICLVCKSRGTPNEPLNYCTRINCRGVYCPQCFNNLKNVCTLCKSPTEYGDLSDESEERGSWSLSHSSSESSESKFDDYSDDEDKGLDYSYQNKPRDIRSRESIEVEERTTEKNDVETVTNKIFDLSPEEKIEDDMVRIGAALTLAQRRQLGLLEFIFPKSYKRAPYLFDLHSQLKLNLTSVQKSKSFFFKDQTSSIGNKKNDKGLIDRFLSVLKTGTLQKSSRAGHDQSESMNQSVQLALYDNLDDVVVHEELTSVVGGSLPSSTQIENDSSDETFKPSGSHDENQMSKVAYLKRKLVNRMIPRQDSRVIRNDGGKPSLVTSWVNTGHFGGSK